MNNFVMIVLLILLLMLSGVTSYYLYDYIKYKTNVTSQVDSVREKLRSEENERLSTYKTVVDQVNKINYDINDTVKKNIGSVLPLSETALMSMSNFLQVKDEDGNYISPLDYSTNTNYNSVNTTVNLVHDMNIKKGLSVKNLDKSGNSFTICGKNLGTGSCNCMVLPDNYGNTIIKNLNPSGDLILQNNDLDKNIVLDGKTIFNNNITMNQLSGNSKNIINTRDINTLAIATDGDLIIGSQNKDYTLYGKNVSLNARGNTIAIGAGADIINNEISLMIDQKGNLNLYKPINLYDPINKQKLGTISLTSDNDLSFKAKNNIILNTGIAVKTTEIEVDTINVKKIKGSAIPYGPRGGIGLQGLIGNIGPTGKETGDTGINGDQGVLGFNGPDGVQGKYGTFGSRGVRGIQGIQGLQGVGGEDSKGSQGMQGVIGSQGSQGSVGELIFGSGIQGSRGSVGFTPELQVGRYGSQGIDGNIGSIGSRGINNSAIGSQGDIGSIGRIGSRGIEGNKGLQGIDGNIGSIGKQGSTGIAVVGSRGSIGNIGSMGKIGSRGIDGIRGHIGYQGSNGSIGVRGQKGSFGSIKGERGPQGYPGIGSMGSIGPKGSRGDYYDSSDPRDWRYVAPVGVNIGGIGGSGGSGNGSGSSGGGGSGSGGSRINKSQCANSPSEFVTECTDPATGSADGITRGIFGNRVGVARCDPMCDPRSA